MRRQRLARILNTAYAEGLLSERTLAHRLDALFAGELIDPARLVGDLTRRVSRPGFGRGLLETLSSGLRRRNEMRLTPGEAVPGSQVRS